MLAVVAVVFVHDKVPAQLVAVNVTLEPRHIVETGADVMTVAGTTVTGKAVLDAVQPDTVHVAT